MPKRPPKAGKVSPENSQKTAEANLIHGEPYRWKPGQSGNPGGRPKTAKLSEAYRAKLTAIVTGDSEGRTYAEAIADVLARRALQGTFEPLPDEGTIGKDLDRKRRNPPLVELWQLVRSCLYLTSNGGDSHGRKLLR